MPPSNSPAVNSPALILASAAVFGSRSIPSEEIDREFGMEIGKLRNRAGILSISRAGSDETEMSLGAQAGRAALEAAGIAADSCDWLITTSETHHAYPSLAAELHDQLRFRDSCGALDVGGECLGLLHALAAARAFLQSGQARRILVVTADVHSRILTADRVRGEFGGLFGDGATAFVLQGAADSSGSSAFAIGEMHFGCASQFAHAIRVEGRPDGRLDVVFEGEALSRAAISKLSQIITELESKSGISRQNVFGLATHQPNPRLVALLAKQTSVSPDRFPAIAEHHGNLGSSTCAAALHQLLTAARRSAQKQQTIFLASLGPGLLYGGGWIASQSQS
jgi:3-oxoacyl-[acyl-carrier-protein] synthase III